MVNYLHYKIILIFYIEIHPLKSNNEWNLCGHCQRNQERKVEELKGFVATNEVFI